MAPPPRSTRSVVGAAVLLLHLLALAAMPWGAQQAPSRSARPEGRAAAAEPITYLTLPAAEPATPQAAAGHPRGLAAAPVASAAAVVHRLAARQPSPQAEAPASAAAMVPHTAMAALVGAPTGALVPSAGVAAGSAGLPALPTLPPTSAGVAPSSTTPVRVAARAVPGNPLPAYPEAAREDGLQGTVHLQVQLDASGRVLAVQWLHRSGVMLLDLAARDAVRSWRFEPARLDGEAVATALTLSIRFQLTQPVSVTMAAA